MIGKQICELFPFAPQRLRKNGSASRTSAWKMACAIFLLCAATTITSPAQTFRTLKNFNGTDSIGSFSLQGLDGNFYGTTWWGGAYNHGTFFKITPGGVLTTIYSFCAETNCADGSEPGSLVQAADGNFYGTTGYGGTSEYCPLTDGCGTVFKITPGGKLTTLYNWCSETNCADGSGGSLVQATDGNFYGMGGGGNFVCGHFGCGTVFKITPNGVLTTLHRFCSETSCPDGYFPYGLIQGTDGNFYGSTDGGNGLYCPTQNNEGCGTVFKITPNGVLTTLHSFCAENNCADGYYPGGLMQGTNGNFYGQTGGGGANDVCGRGTGCGTFFKITSGGKLTTLHTFCVDDGDLCNGGDLGTENPGLQLVQGTDGNFYGSTLWGGSHECYQQGFQVGCGMVVKITPKGKVTVLYEFCEGCSDGWEPNGLFQATDGNIYGATSRGGGTQCDNVYLYGCGTLFRITPTGKLTTLHRFCAQAGCPDGYQGTFVVQATSGTFYGTTAVGGAYGAGTVFSLCVGLGWFVETLPTSGKVGDSIDILGANLTGASYVTFNGIMAPFTVISATLIQATVPSGARTGYVKVTLPSGRIRSNKKFRVML